MTLSPPLSFQEKKDAEHLLLLGIFHCIFAALGLAGIGFLFVYYNMMHAIFDNPEIWKNGKNASPPPKEFFTYADYFLRIAAGYSAFSSVTHLLSGICLLRKKLRILSLVVAGFNCIQIPFGTILGIFTLVVLSRDSVREMYERNRG